MLRKHRNTPDAVVRASFAIIWLAQHEVTSIESQGFEAIQVIESTHCATRCLTEKYAGPRVGAGKLETKMECDKHHAKTSKPAVVALGEVSKLHYDY